MLTEELCDSKLSLSKLAEPVTLYPQYTKNLRVRSKAAALSDPDVLAKATEIERKIGGEGRVLLRKSGTEPVIRIMIECVSEALCHEYADAIATVVAEKGHLTE